MQPLMTLPNLPSNPSINRGNMTPENWNFQRAVQARLLNLLSSYGYRYIDVPVLQPTDLFLRKSGGELASQMFSFLDLSGRQVSLRPEFTAPIMVQHLQESGAVPWPARWRYAGPVFRFGGPDSDDSGQFMQVGAELIGSTAVLADAELISLAAHVVRELGIEDCQIRLSDLRVLQGLLDTLDLSDRAKSFLADSLPSLSSGDGGTEDFRERAEYLHITGQDPENHDLAPAIAGLDDEQARQVLRGFLHWRHGDAPELGQRHPDEVLERLLRKLRGSDDQARLDHAFSLVTDLARIKGAPETACRQARQVLQSAGADPSSLDRLLRLAEILGNDGLMGVDLQIDFGLARGFAYYNGIIFQVSHPARTAPIGGGGRYDPLALALGSRMPVPALGFAYNLDTLAALAPDGAGDSTDGQAGANPSSSVLVVPESPAADAIALKTADELRRRGHQVTLEVCGLDSAELATRAAAYGCDSVVMVKPDGSQTDSPVS